MVFIISPDITLTDKLDINKSNEFFYGFKNAIRNSNFEIVEVTNSSDIRNRVNDIKNEDIYVFFNTNTPSTNIDKLLKIAKENNCLIYPIALNETYRNPPKEIQKIQSYDIITQIRNRNLSENSLSIIGEIFGREIIIKNSPTLYNTSMTYFISHRRSDGELIAYDFNNNLDNNLDKGFIDLLKVNAGEDAQNIIENELPKSDLLILLQTSDLKNSYYALKEIKIALRENIPVVWVLLPDADENDLKIKPVGTPHYKISVNDMNSDKTIKSEKAQEIINFGFELVKEQKSKYLDIINSFKEYLQENEYILKVLDKKYNIYSVIKQIEKNYYSHRDTQYLIKCMARTVQDSDVEYFEKLINKEGFITAKGNHFDSSLILSPKEKKKICKENFYVDSYTSALNNLCQNKTEQKINKKVNGIIISGAFPKYEEENLNFQQNLLDAMHILVELIYEYSGKIIFGSHPTFQGLIIEKSKKESPENYKEKTKLYVSKFFEGKYDNEYLKDNSIMFEIEKKENITESLTVMRNSMISDGDAQAIVCLGGVKSDGKPTGIDEEISIAKKRGLEVFVIGSCGGRASELINKDGFNFFELNKLSVEENQSIYNSSDYRKTFQKILDHLSSLT